MQDLMPGHIDLTFRAGCQNFWATSKSCSTPAIEQEVLHGREVAAMQQVWSLDIDATSPTDAVPADERGSWS
jgi:hypothetical protein